MVFTMIKMVLILVGAAMTLRLLLRWRSSAGERSQRDVREGMPFTVAARWGNVIFLLLLVGYGIVAALEAAHGRNEFLARIVVGAGIMVAVLHVLAGWREGTGPGG